MQIILPPEVEARVQRQLKSGKYQTAIEVILAGVQLLEQQEDPYQGRLEELQQEAQKGWDAVQNGERGCDGDRPNSGEPAIVARHDRNSMTPQFRLTEPAIQDIEQIASRQRLPRLNCFIFRLGDL